jgi:hypothetical protein
MIGEAIGNFLKELANLFKEVWTGYRPYLVKFMIDLLVTATLWLVLFVFKVLTDYLPITGWAGEFIVNLHSAGTVFIVAIFVLLSAIDIIQVRGGKVECFV